MIPVWCAVCQRIFAVRAVSPEEPCPFCGSREVREGPRITPPAVTKPPGCEFTVITEKTVETARRLVKDALGANP